VRQPFSIAFDPAWLLFAFSAMQIGLRKLTAREHLLSASVLVFALTMMAADIMLPDAAQLRSEGHPRTALTLSVLPVFVFVAGLLALLPRTGNESHHACFRLAGRLPLLVRYLLVGLLFYGLAATIKSFAG
jgi:hypothetical protein